MTSILNICAVLLLCVAINGDVYGAPPARELNAEEEPVKYNDAQLWRVDLDDENAKEILRGLESENDETSIWNSDGKTADLFLKRSAIEDVRQQFKVNNISYSVVVDDLQKKIDEENPKEDESQYQNRSGHRMTWTSYHRTQDIYGFMEYLARTYPQLCRLLTIGASVENRPLKVLRISNGRKNRNIWIDGGIHSREWISPASVTYIINDLVTNWSKLPAYIQNINWYIQPLVNPDGYEFTHTSNRLWRKNRSGTGNCRGVDLNRNYGYRWGGLGTSPNPCSDIYCGPGPFSEPETRAHRDFFQSAPLFFAFLTFHSYGQYILYPWGYATELPADHQQLHQLGLRAAQEIQRYGQVAYRVGSSAILLYPAAGGSDDWAKSIGVKYAYTPELRDTGRHGFVLPANLIIPTARDALIFTRVVAFYVATAAKDVNAPESN